MVYSMYNYMNMIEKGYLALIIVTIFGGSVFFTKSQKVFMGEMKFLVVTNFVKNEVFKQG